MHQRSVQNYGALRTASFVHSKSARQLKFVVLIQKLFRVQSRDNLKFMLFTSKEDTLYSSLYNHHATSQTLAKVTAHGKRLHKDVDGLRQCSGNPTCTGVETMLLVFIFSLRVKNTRNSAQFGVDVQNISAVSSREPWLTVSHESTHIQISHEIMKSEHNIMILLLFSSNFEIN